ncbi:hypothetical protein [Rubritalea tangerina]|uniref:hypothetical protein n=1 Tax=Rubritalea tangerina TaxID=430798 RepID=UPI00361BB243
MNAHVCVPGNSGSDSWLPGIVLRMRRQKKATNLRRMVAVVMAAGGACGLGYELFRVGF